MIILAYFKSCVFGSYSSVLYPTASCQSLVIEERAPQSEKIDPYLCGPTRI